MKKSVLIVDDEMVNIIVEKKIMEIVGFKDCIETADSVSSAVNYLKDLSKDQWPSFILLDLTMPIQDGFDFIIQFEEFPQELRANTKIYIISSYLDPSVCNRIKSFSSIAGVMDKPLTINIARNLFIEENEEILLSRWCR
jgi:CheY-like chemotaxis protein